VEEPVRRLLFILQVFVVMSLPVPQAAYAAIGFGRTIGLDLLHMIPMYILSDVIAFAVVVWVTRRYGRRGIARLLRPLPERFSRPFDRVLGERRTVVPLSAMFATGYANLYLAALVTGLSPMRTLPSSLLGIAGDVFQFTGTVLLASLVMKMLPFRGSEWAVLLTLPALVAVVPFGLQGLKRLVERLCGLPAVLPPAPVPVPIPVRADDGRPR
jgi:hypothetical protein